MYFCENGFFPGFCLVEMDSISGWFVSGFLKCVCLLVCGFSCILCWIWLVSGVDLVCLDEVDEFYVRCVAFCDALKIGCVRGVVVCLVPTRRWNGLFWFVRSVYTTQETSIILSRCTHCFTLWVGSLFWLEIFFFSAYPNAYGNYVDIMLSFLARCGPHNLVTYFPICSTLYLFTYLLSRHI